MKNLSRIFDKYISNEMLSSYDICRTKVHRYLDEIEDSYHEIPYHNIEHAASVMHACACLFDKCMFSERLDDASFYHIILMISAATHDVDHPGADKTGFTEQHHLVVAHRILDDHQNDFIQSEERHPDKFVHIMDQLILKTDMGLHGECLNSIRHLFPIDSSLTKINKKNIVDVLGVVLKCADLWHVVSPWSVHREWTEKYLDESGGIIQDTFVQDQIWFLKAICKPCFLFLGKVCPTAQDLNNNLDSNIHLWKTLPIAATA